MRLNLLKLSRPWTILVAVVLLLSGTVRAATYYVDFETGSDRNSGTSKTSPWKHSPAMAPFSGTYNAATSDRFIYKGGVTWPNSALPLLIKTGGTEAAPAYHGVDKSWYRGTNWSRPRFDAQNQLFTNHGGNRGNVIWVAAPDVRIEGLEITRFVFEDPAPRSNSDGFGIYGYRAHNMSVEDVFIHNWEVRAYTDSKFGGLAAQDTDNAIAKNCIVIAPKAVAAEFVTDSKGGQTSGCGIIGFTLIDGCEFIGTTQGIWGGRVIRNNIVRDGQKSFDAAAHENGAWVQNTADFYNNRIFNVGEGVGVYFLPGWGGRENHRINVFNNIFFDTPQINLTPQDSPSSTNEIWFFNNVIKQSSFCIQVGTTKQGEAFRKLVISNNIFISEWKYSNPNRVVSILDVTDLGVGFSSEANEVFTLSEANDAGMSTSNFFKPASTERLALRGTNNSSITTADIEGQMRPTSGAWDIGPYQLTNQSGLQPPNPPSALVVKEKM